MGRGPPGHHYQADAGSACEAIPHGADCVAGARPLAIPRAFAHGIRAAASVVLRWGQERGSSDSQDSSASPGEGAASFPVQAPEPRFLLIRPDLVAKVALPPEALRTPLGLRKAGHPSPAPPSLTLGVPWGPDLGAGVQEHTGPDAVPTITFAAAAGDLSQIPVRGEGLPDGGAPLRRPVPRSAAPGGGRPSPSVRFPELSHLLGACGDTVGMHVAAPMVDETAVGFWGKTHWDEGWPLCPSVHPSGCSPPTLRTHTPVCPPSPSWPD